MENDQREDEQASTGDSRADKLKRLEKPSYNRETKHYQKEWKRYIENLSTYSDDVFEQVEMRFFNVQLSEHCPVDRQTLRYGLSYLEFREIEDEITTLNNNKYIAEELHKHKEALEQSKLRATAPAGFYDN